MRNFKFIFWMLLCFITMMTFATSCAENDILADNNLDGTIPISFSSSYIGKPTNSRAAGDIDKNNVTGSSFYVWGEYYDKSKTYNDAAAETTNLDKIFDKQIVSHETNRWDYTPHKYWDSDKRYSFVGVMPAITESDNKGINGNYIRYEGGKVNITNIPLTQQIKDFDGNNIGIDYLVSEAVDDRTIADGTVLLNFKHILSRFSIYVYTGSNADVTLTDMNIYLPKGKATYIEENHSGPVSRVVNAIKKVKPTNGEGDEWVWYNFENSTTGVTNKYDKCPLTNKTISVPYFNGVPTTSDKISEGKTEGVYLMPAEFFMAPIDKDKLAIKEDLQLYMSFKFIVNYKDSIKQTIERSTPVLIHDLHSFTQNYKTNLFVKLLSENDVISFNVSVDEFENETHHWVDQDGYSFALVDYRQDYKGEEPKSTISGILDSYGNTYQGDYSDSELTYFLTELYPEAGGDNILTGKKQLNFNGWSDKVDGDFNQERTKDNHYGKFTISLSGETIEAGDYWMVIKNTLNDVRKYLIHLEKFAPSEYFMSFTVRVNDNDKYAIPFVTYEAATNCWENSIGVTGSGWNYVWSTTMENFWANGMSGNPEDFMTTCFSYPSKLYIDWGDNTELQVINKGTPNNDVNLPIHNYTYSGDYTITIYSDSKYNESQIPQINWGWRHITFSSKLGVNSLGNEYDCKLISVDTPILTIDENWWEMRLTFGPEAIAAPFNLGLMCFMTRFGNTFMGSSWLNGQPYYGSPLTMMFDTVGRQFTQVSDNLFIYNTDWEAADFTFQFCHGLTSIPATTFKNCKWILEMLYTFDNCDKLSGVPAGLFDSLTNNVWFKCTFLDCTQLNNSNVSNNLFDNCGSDTKLEGTFNGTGVTKYS